MSFSVLSSPIDLDKFRGYPPIFFFSSENYNLNAENRSLSLLFAVARTGKRPVVSGHAIANSNGRR